MVNRYTRPLHKLAARIHAAGRALAGPPDLDVLIDDAIRQAHANPHRPVVLYLPANVCIDEAETIRQAVRTALATKDRP